MPTRSLRTWLLPGAHVAKPAAAMSFFFLFYGLNGASVQHPLRQCRILWPDSVISWVIKSLRMKEV